eukprot:CAMPEP_0194420728 /NCGR_PEP_ID=MMETSP0176-20130528/20017_1 /TAXON_ID=216777 /ORGANISM="Proboscia alata, Strain PI-D3" /LENGTH=65 /DNA_ID=CAMNT_0039228503 /DNA_START=316 /DNA_END=509 /DNA_ORIENTATION=-
MTVTFFLLSFEVQRWRRRGLVGRRIGIKLANQITRDRSITFDDVAFSTTRMNYMDNTMTEEDEAA